MSEEKPRPAVETATVDTQAFIDDPGKSFAEAQPAQSILAAAKKRIEDLEGLLQRVAPDKLAELGAGPDLGK